MTGPQLRIIRECAGLSQLKLAQMIGTSQTWISRFERGLSIIPEEIAEKIAVTFPQAVRSAKVEKEEAPPKGRRTRPKQIAEDKAAEVAWKRQTEAHLRGDARHGARQYVENDTSESTDRGVVSKESTESSRLPSSFEIRLSGPVELGPQTLKSLRDMVMLAVQELVAPPVRIKPEVIEAAKEGDRYRERTQAVLNGRGW